MKTWHIHIEGQVQGVGFRPFVYKMALEHKLTGWVNNDVDGVHIRFNASQKVATSFFKKIQSDAPVLSIITGGSLVEADQEDYNDFSIVESMQSGSPDLLLTPDFAICPDCRKELFNPSDRRFEYPFITCTNCGPRFSISEALPYDRPRTTMDPFKMCDPCHLEYNDPLERRHYSQTNSCDSCGIDLTLWRLDKIEKGPSIDLITETCNQILNGKIVAVKGIGGYLLFADATNEEAIRCLRMRKHRPSKPFALMYPDIATVRKDVRIRTEEERILQGKESPILLVKLKKSAGTGIVTQSIAPGLGEIGIMLPYTPLFALMMSKINKPVIATSGNISGSPVIFEDEIAKEHLSQIADYLLINNREIIGPQDDSVLKVLPDNSNLVLRRSRGYAPTFITPTFEKSSPDVLAMGAMLKSTFALRHNGNTYISQYLGDLEYYDTQESYNHTLSHFLKLFQPQLTSVIVDTHPQYYSTQRGLEIAEDNELPLVEVQHHEAHLMSVLAENELEHSNESILGVIWDGTGFGHDGNIWGGEFFSFQDGTIERVDHLPYYDHILGDKFSREPRLAALSLCDSNCLNAGSLDSKFSTKELEFYLRKLDQKDNLKTSSMGRLFDGVSSMLGLKDYNSFEGEAAMHLQVCAEQFAIQNGIIDNTFISLNGDTKQCLNEIMIGVNAGIDPTRIAYDFLLWLVHKVYEQAVNLDIEKIAFSGGVFQNSLLLFLLKKRLESEFELYFHRKLSPNDECISYGQLVHEYIGVNTLAEKEKRRVLEEVKG